MLVHIVLFPPSFLSFFIALYISQDFTNFPPNGAFDPLGKSGRGVITSACLAELFSSWCPIKRKSEDPKEDP